jgi:hypothetical protein
VDPDFTIFRLASISKLFTWVSVMQLVEQGKLGAGAASKTRTEILSAFADRYYPSVEAPNFQKLAAAEVKAIKGTYQATRRADSTKLSLGNLISQADADVDKDGILKIDEFKDLRGHVRKWKPIGKDLWQDENDGFSRSGTALGELRVSR